MESGKVGSGNGSGCNHTLVSDLGGLGGRNRVVAEVVRSGWWSGWWSVEDLKVEEESGTVEAIRW